nr:proline-rich protein 2-like [Aegilops tauschii subsp. strangulata]
MTGNDSRDDAFKKGMIFATAGPSEDRTGFHLGQHSPSPNATPRQPRRPHGHGDRAAPRHGLCPRALRYHHQGRRPSIQDLDTTSPETRRSPTKETSGKVPPFALLGDPQRRDPIGRPKLASTDPSCSPERETSSVLLHRQGDEVSPAAPCARQARSCCIGRGTSSVLQHRGTRRAVDRSWERTNPLMGVTPERRGDGVKAETSRPQTSRRWRSRPLSRTDPSSYRGAATTPGGHHRDLPTPPPTAGAVATPGRCPTRAACRKTRIRSGRHAPTCTSTSAPPTPTERRRRPSHGRREGVHRDPPAAARDRSWTTAATRRVAPGAPPAARQQKQAAPQHRQSSSPPRQSALRPSLPQPEPADKGIWTEGADPSISASPAVHPSAQPPPLHWQAAPPARPPGSPPRRPARATRPCQAVASAPRATGEGGQKTPPPPMPIGLRPAVPSGGGEEERR